MAYTMFDDMAYEVQKKIKREKRKENRMKYLVTGIICLLVGIGIAFGGCNIAYSQEETENNWNSRYLNENLMELI